MKNLITILFLAGLWSSAFAQAADSTQTAELNVVILKINAALTAVQQTPGIPKLDNATVKLETTYDRSGGGGFKIFVKASRKWTKESANSITYKYKSVESLKETAVKNELVDIIKNAALAYQKSATITGLEKESFEIEVSFSMTKTTSGGVEFEIYGIGFDGDAEWERKVGHTITLEFK